MFKTKLHILLKEIKEEIRAKLSTLKINEIRISKKMDHSIVTEMDIFISELFEKKLKVLDSSLNFYSEENQNSFNFPMVILDPIDGTKEFAKGLDECVVSFGVYYSKDLDDKRNFSWIYNFHNGFEISSDTPKIEKKNRVEKLKGFVSKTEFKASLYESKSNIIAVGSIAYKLALLANGDCDFVVTRRPKNIWDILAGTHICQKQGISFYQNESEKFEITKELYLPQMLWCNNQHLKDIKVHI